MKRICSLLFVAAIMVGGVFAQLDPARKTINAGILNPRALTMPKPEFPEAAKQARHGGLVAVDVTVDESGLVISAAAEDYDQHEVKNADGTKAESVKLDPELMRAAEDVARQATFKPFLLKGQPVKITGRLIYNFIVDNSNLPPRVGEIYGPSLMGAAVKFPQPANPAEASGISGSVTVHVTVDETGKVTSATAISGPTALRAAAEEAALKAEFKPSLLAGEPVQIRGVLIYTFATTRKSN